MDDFQSAHAVALDHEEALHFAEQRERAAKEYQVALERIDQMFADYILKAKERKDSLSI